MKITFEVTETISEIREYCESNKYWDYDGVPYRNKARLVDLEFTDSWTEMTWIGELLIFTTAWSGFGYEIEERDGKTYCSYNGTVVEFIEAGFDATVNPSRYHKDRNWNDG